MRVYVPALELATCATNSRTCRCTAARSCDRKHLERVSPVRGYEAENETYSAGAGHNQHRDGKKRTHGVLLFQDYVGLSYMILVEILYDCCVVEKHRLAVVASGLWRKNRLRQARASSTRLRHCHVTDYVDSQEASLSGGASEQIIRLNWHTAHKQMWVQLEDLCNDYL